MPRRLSPGLAAVAALAVAAFGMAACAATSADAAPLDRPRWTREDALVGHRTRLDTNHDGNVTQPEYQVVAWSAPPFASADANTDGNLDNGEVVALFLAQSPTRFDDPGRAQSAPQGGNERTRGALSPPFSAEKRAAWETLFWIADTLRSAGAEAPNAAAIDAAIVSGRLDTDVSIAVLASMQREWEAQGWAWPLLPSAIGTAPARATPPPTLP